MYPVETINYWLSVGVVLMQIATLALLALFLLQKKIPDLQSQADFIGRWGLWLGFLVTLAGSAIAFFYSDVLGFAACWHCWVQRVFFCPQVILFAVALWYKDKSVANYSIVLSIFGAIDALYQHYLQMGGSSPLPCPAVPGAADCAQRFLFEFGYITFPLMAFSLFAFLIVLMLFARRSR